MLSQNVVSLKIRLLLYVDLVITHGGNNTIIESLYFGQPLLLLSWFDNQPWNGRRIETQELDKCFNLYKVTEEELLTGIETNHGNEEMIKKVTQIGKMIRRSKSKLNFVVLKKIGEDKENGVMM